MTYVGHLNIDLNLPLSYSIICCCCCCQYCKGKGCGMTRVTLVMWPASHMNHCASWHLSRHKHKPELDIKSISFCPNLQGTGFSSCPRFRRTGPFFIRLWRPGITSWFRSSWEAFHCSQVMLKNWSNWTFKSLQVSWNIMLILKLLINWAN